VRSSLYLRQLALAALAGIGVVAVLAVRQARQPTRPALPPALGSYTAEAGASDPGARGCGVEVGPGTDGIETPVIPCGTRLYVTYRGETVLASVVAHSPTLAGREFGLTGALASRLRLVGVDRVRWSYAAATP
jgi:hypothetical protein